MVNSYYPHVQGIKKHAQVVPRRTDSYQSFMIYRYQRHRSIYTLIIVLVVVLFQARSCATNEYVLDREFITTQRNTEKTPIQVYLTNDTCSNQVFHQLRFRAWLVHCSILLAKIQASQIFSSHLVCYQILLTSYVLSMSNQWQNLLS